MPFSLRKNSSSEEKYQYKPLRDKNSDIRILVLNSKGLCKPGIINASIYHAYLGAKPDYEVLSCTWSSREEQVTIFLGLRKRRLRIPLSLARALLDLQHQTDSRQLWIDAISIDQGNKKEKTQHVASRMTDIYRKAARVTYWIGPSDDSITTAFKILLHMSKMIVVNRNDGTINSSQNAKNASLETWADSTSSLPISGEQMGTISKLLRQDWFDRVWSLQEIWLTGHRANIVCGKTFIKWTNFHTAIICLYLNSSSYRDFEIDLPGRVQHIMQLCDATDYAPLSSLLDFVRTAKCDDPKDKIYAILNLIHPQYQLDIQPNYEKTTSEVYTDLVLQYIGRRSRLDLLRGCHLDDKDDDIPSWVPNLAREDTHKAFPEWSADADSACDAEPYGEGVLKVYGRQIATVKETQWIHFDDNTNPVISVIRRLAPTSLDGEYVSGGSVFDAYCRTLGADQFSDMSWPQNLEWPDFSSSRAALRKFLDVSNSSTDALSGEARFLHSIHTALQDCHFLTTDEGYIGLGPRAAKPGDKVCVLPGSRGLMLLRRHTSHGNNHEVVGQIFMYGLMKGEGLLGPLPKPYQAAMRQDPAQGWACGFLNLETEEWQYGDDPRLSPFRDQTVNDQSRDAASSVQNNLQTKGVKPRLTVKDLLQEGVALRLFYLI